MKTRQKWSIYNYMSQHNQNIILYNVASDTVIALLPQIKELLDKYRENPEDLEEIHPPLYRFLTEKAFIINQEDEASQLLIDSWKKEETNPEIFSVTINPTLDCNLRCWYCYEKHHAHMNMEPEVVESIKKLLENKIKDPLLKQLNISFFGGEPLMKYKEVVRPIITHAKTFCDQFQKKLSIRFTTNGVLITPAMINELEPFNKKHPVFFQITLDGNREVHDETRHNQGGGKTFDTIIKHIKELLDAKMEVNIRFNYTARNIDTFSDVLKEFEQLSDSQKGMALFDFQQVWQDKETSVTNEKVKNIVTHYHNAGLRTTETKSIRKIHCYADYENSVVINYTGDLYKCTARDFSPETKEGVITTDGQLAWNARYQKRMAIKYGTTLCQACRIYPICHGGCSQSKMERSGKCPHHYTEQEKEDILEQRMQWVLQNHDVSF